MGKLSESNDFLDSVVRYYSEKLEKYGPVPEGADWNSKDGQDLRFQQLAKLLPSGQRATVLDFGCGYGALLNYLIDSGSSGSIRYTGYDLSPAMIEASKRTHSGISSQWTNRLSSEERYDYVLASGLFNVRLLAEQGDWERYMKETLQQFNALSIRGFAFNALSLYSDADRRRPDLHYADPLELFDFCKRTYSRSVALLHDYPLYEFTILVSKP